EDCPKNVVGERRSLIPQLEEPRKEGKTAHLRYNKLIINNKIQKTKKGKALEGNDNQQGKAGKKEELQGMTVLTGN
ncbi:hypothetical protein ILUMI_03636, partial [Ignelater luminosus]